MSSLSTVQDLLIAEFGLTADRVGPDSLLEDLQIDSLSVIEFMFLIEEKFKLTMPGEQVVVKTVGDIAREVDGLIASREAALQ